MIKINYNDKTIEIDDVLVFFKKNNKVHHIHKDNINIKISDNQIKIYRDFQSDGSVFYFYDCNAVFLTTSINELKSIKQLEIDELMLDECLTYGYILPPKTFMKGVFILSNFINLIISLKGNSRKISVFYDFSYRTFSKAKLNKFDIFNKVERIKKYALLFSGGLDSTIIAKKFKNVIKCYLSSGFSFEKCDMIEKKYADTAAYELGININYKSYDFKDLLALLPEAINSSQNVLNHVQTLLMYKLIEEVPDDIHYILNGQGADAIFGTFNQFQYVKGVADCLKRIKTIKHFDFVKNAVTLSHENFDMNVYNEHYNELYLDNYIDLIGDCDITINSWSTLSKHFHKKMIFPFYTKENYDYINNFPWEYRSFEQKYVLKKIAKLNGISEEIIKRKKASFGPVSDKWGKYLLLLLPICSEFLGIKLDHNSILAKKEYRYNLWNLINISIWKMIFINNIPVKKIKRQIKNLLKENL